MTSEHMLLMLVLSNPSPMSLTWSSSNRLGKDTVPRGVYESETAENGLRNELPMKQ